ncbi:MAG: type IV pilus assembly protein PilM [Desulfonatronovibrionaceae bacterium]
MTLITLRKQQSPKCGVDIGSSWGKVAKLAVKRRRVSLESVGRMAWQPKELEKPAAMGGRIRSLWEALDLKDRVVVSSMAGHAVIVKRVLFDRASQKDMAANVQEQAKQYIPFDINDVYLDYQVMKEEPEGKNLDVMLVASKKKVVQDLIGVLEKAGLSLNVVDVDAFALSNCFEYNYPDYTDAPVYLWDIGGQQSVFCVYWQNQPLFFREMNVGGRHVTDALAGALNLNRSEAEKIKLEGPDGLTEDQKSAVQDKLQSLFEGWSSEVKRLVGFYLNSMPEAEPAKKLMLSGGGSLLPGLRKAMAAGLELEVERFDPWRQIAVDSNRFDFKYIKSVAPQFAVATGLGLRGVI